MAKKGKRRVRHSMAPFRVHREVGVPPGAIIAEPGAASPVLHIIGYGPNEVEERHVESVSELRFRPCSKPVMWINIDGLGDAETFSELGKIFGLHPLALEDVIHVHQRPKVEAYGDNTFIVMRMPLSAGSLELEQVSIFLGANYVITIQERLGGDCLDTLRERIRLDKGRVRKAGADYLAYAVVDTIIDNFFPILETYADRLEGLENKILVNSEGEDMIDIHGVRQELHALRRVLWPMREMVNTLARGETPGVTAETRVFFRDCVDHTGQLLDVVDSCRELSASLVELHLAGMSQKMNEVMKVLTLISTIFIPLSFIASVYGMNFDTSASALNMPELHWHLGYPFALLLMTLTAGGLVYYFRRKGWFGSTRRGRNGAAGPSHGP